MKKPKTDKMKEKQEKMKAKASKLATQLKGATKTATAIALLVILGVVTGCQDTKPASRSNDAAYGDFEPSIVINGSSNVVTVAITIGDGVYADASGGGDSQSTTPTQTTDTKPEVAVGVGGGSAGTGSATPASGLLDKATNALKGVTGLGTPTNETSVNPAVNSSCTDGNCTPVMK